MDRYIGKFLDNRYELLEVIGTGGMAVVYKARCHRLNRLVAVKILKQDLAQDAEFRRRFHDESQAVAMLSHPNIVAVYDVSHSDDLDYIVMELIDGITLKQYMQKKGAPLNWREALHFITQIMRGLSHAHSRGIIHRDIKPHNIMVLRDGSVKVSDFGIARITSANQSSLTQEALGSVHYISPEQARGSHIDARSDIYSAGVVLYEMTTGRLPFEGESPVAVAIQHINSIPLSPRDINPEIPEALQEIIMKAMSPDPNERYLSADDMLTDLEEFRKNPNINFDYTPEDLKPGNEPTRPVPVGPIHAKEDPRREEPRREVPAREEPSKPRRRPEREAVVDDYDTRGPVWPILLAVGAIVAFIAGIIWFLWSSFFSDIVNPETQSFPVPDLQGMTLTEIRQDSGITDKFEIVEGEFIPSEEFEAGQVVDQTPKKNEMVKANDGEKVTITVDISSGGSEMTIPKVENMEQRAAMELLRDSMGLVVSQELEANEEITKNYAIRTDLPEGTPVKRGDRVTLVISSGPDLKEIMVVPVTQMTLEVARKTLEDMELAVGQVDEEPSETVEAGTVLWQSIPGGTKVLAGTAIDLRVSSGPATPSDDPDVSTPPDVSPSPGVGDTTPPPAVTDPPEPTPSQPASGSKAIPVSLPASAADKSAVNVRIEVDGEVKHNNTVETGLFPISPRITGRGNQQVSIYVDDVLVDQYMVDFSA